MEENFYRHARAYDIAFTGRDYSEEYKFIKWCFNRHGKVKNSSKTFLEIGCGPAHHAKEFAKRGWKTYALDISAEMIAYARLNFEKENLSAAFIEADMIDFSLAEPVDLICNFNESITHVLTNEDFITHLKSVSKNLYSGGIYIIETAHPFYFFPDSEPNIWTTMFENEEVELLFGLPDDEYDSVNQIWNLTTRFSTKEKGKKKVVVEYQSKHRWYLSQELKSLIQLSDEFDDFWFYGNMEIPPHPLDDSDECDCMVVVIRKK